MNKYVKSLTGEGIFTLLPGMDKALISAMNEWRARQNPPVEPNEAILALLRIALEGEGLLRNPEAPRVDPALEALIAEFRALSPAKAG